MDPPLCFFVHTSWIHLASASVTASPPKASSAPRRGSELRALAELAAQGRAPGGRHRA